jgi:hypothetical protein
MEEKIKQVISDIVKTKENAKIDNPINILHLLIAYLRVPVNKQPEDYAINTVVTVLIKNILATIEEDKIELSKKEITILCNCISLDTVKDVIKEEINKQTD